MFRPKRGSQTDRSIEIFNFISENHGACTGELVRTFGHEFNQQLNYRNRVWKKTGVTHVRCKKSTEQPNQFFYYAVPATRKEGV